MNNRDSDCGIGVDDTGCANSDWGSLCITALQTVTRSRSPCRNPIIPMANLSDSPCEPLTGYLRRNRFLEGAEEAEEAGNVLEG